MSLLQWSVKYLTRTMWWLHHLLEKKNTLYHVNVMKPYYVSESVQPALAALSLPVGSSGIVNGKEVGITSDDGILCGQLKNSEFLEQMDKSLAYLSEPQCAELIQLINKYTVLFEDMASCTSWIKHDIDVGDSKTLFNEFKSRVT